ncbi:MFS transporter [Agromyces archimandritae]|uniref:MFS transporter n=1 Tax=Agromyces archimandritae TaxID=2781962 RepID=A0A975FKR5_9MICO|nr:MFS transporter [Agromyces archimandritae]QTX04320.1 MFS transporter [Agromyces archimandritae]
MPTSPAEFRWRSIILPAYLPTLLFSLGEGAMIPVIPMVATDRGATIALAGLVAAMIMVGELAGDLPAGWLVSRIGERTSMIGAAMLAVIGILVALAAPSVLSLGIGIFLLGLATAVFGLARHAFLTSYVPVRSRARALSTLAGVFRGGWAVGPFLAAALIAWTGSTETVFWVLVAACFAVIVVLLVLPDPERVFARRAADSPVDAPSTAAVGSAAPGSATAGTAEAAADTSHGVFRAIVRHREVLTRIGTGAGLLAALRSSRTVIVPLWAVSIGMSPEAASIVIGISATIDFALFYVSGQVMDRFGRLWGAMPGLIGLTIGHFVLALTHDVPGNVTWFIVVAMLFGLANGLSSGVIMTLGADLAPTGNPAPFLGAYRTIADAGQAAAPLALSGIASVLSLSFASAAMGVVGILGTAMLWRWVPRYVPRRPRG